MLMEPKKISEMIRAKKKKMMEASPEVVDTDSKPDMNPQGIMDLKDQSRIEATLDSPHKIDARDAGMMDDDLNVGLHPDDKMRLERLRKYIGTLHISGK